MQPNISIIIPTFNRIKTLEMVLPSYLQQENLLEIIIVDDCSPDETGKLIESLNNPKIKYIRHQKNMGLPAARNTGIHAAKGEYIAMGEDDLNYHKDYLKVLLEKMLRAKADIAGGKGIYLVDNETFDHAIKRVKVNIKPYFNKYMLNLNFSYNCEQVIDVPFIHPWVLMTKDIATKTLYDTVFIGNYLREETDFYFRAKKGGAKIIFVPFTYAFHMPIDNIKGGCWNSGIFRYQLFAIRNNFIFSKRHFLQLKKIGLKSNFWGFNVLHVINRGRIVWRYFLNYLKNKLNA